VSDDEQFNDEKWEAETFPQRWSPLDPGTLQQQQSDNTNYWKNQQFSILCANTNNWPTISASLLLAWKYNDQDIKHMIKRS